MSSDKKNQPISSELEEEDLQYLLNMKGKHDNIITSPTHLTLPTLTPSEEYSQQQQQHNTNSNNNNNNNNSSDDNNNNNNGLNTLSTGNLSTLSTTSLGSGSTTYLAPHYPSFPLHKVNSSEKLANITLNHNIESGAQPRRRRRTSLIILEESEAIENKLRLRSGQKLSLTKEMKTEEIIEDTLPLDDFYMVPDPDKDVMNKEREYGGYGGYNGVPNKPTALELKQAASFVDDANTGRYEMHRIDRFSLTLYYLYHHVCYSSLFLSFNLQPSYSSSSSSNHDHHH